MLYVLFSSSLLPKCNDYGEHTLSKLLHYLLFRMHLDILYLFALYVPHLESTIAIRYYSTES